MFCLIIEEHADHDFDWNNVEIFQSESNKGKREFMEMLYINREGRTTAVMTA